MKTISTIALSALLIGSAGIAEAGPLDFLFKKNDDRHDHRDDHRGPGPGRGHDDRFDRDRGRPRMSTEARAQLRLRELGYYRGPIDGSFGRGSRASLARFQRDNRLRPTGYLDERTRNALRL